MNELEKIKISMLAYVDYFGRQFSDLGRIKAATTREELIEIIDDHSLHISDLANEAQRTLEDFKSHIGLKEVYLKKSKRK